MTLPFDSAAHPRSTDSGEFEVKTQSAPTVELADESKFVAVKGSRSGHYEVQSPETGPRVSGGWVTITVGGEPHINQRIGAALRLFDEDMRNEADQTARELAGAGEKMTVLVDRGNRVEVVEGTGALYRDGEVLFLKGSKQKFYEIRKLKLLAVTKGYGHQNRHAAGFDAVAALVPATEKATLDGIPEAESADQEDARENGTETIAAAYLVAGPDFGDGPEPGCVFLATDIQTEDKIVNGYFWAPDDAGQLTSEHGSMYTYDLGRQGGRIRDYVPGSVNFADCFNNIPEGRAEGYAYILGK